MTQNQIDNLSVGQRLAAPLPKFFQKLQWIGVLLAAVGASVLAAPVALPAIVVTIAGYVTVAGSVIGAISQATVEH